MKFTSAAKFIEGDLDTIDNPVVEEAYRFSQNLYQQKKEELRKQAVVQGVQAPTQEEIDKEYNSFDLFSTDETPVSRFADAVERELTETGYTDKGVPGISIDTQIAKEDVGPSSYSVNKATIAVTFSQERLQEFRKWLTDCSNNLALYHLDQQAS